MARDISIEELRARNQTVDAGLLRERLQLTQKMGYTRSRYRYNLVPPFGGRRRRQPVAEVGGPNDNVRKGQ